MAKNGGKREGAGRKPKAEEQQLIEKLNPLEPEALKQLEKQVRAGEKWAIELFFKYKYGMPKQQTDITTNGNDVNISPIEWVE
jgi:hypothetical protein